MKLARRLVKTFLILTGVALLGLVIFIWIAAGWLISPPRRALQDYHHEWLEHAAAHGMAVERFAALDGKLPCLLVQPDAAHGPGDRGTILRKQLTEKGYALGDYGTVRGTLVLLHGREGRKEDALPVAERFIAAGFRCILVDLPSHGESPLKSTQFGSSPFECDLASAALHEAAARFHFSPEPAGLWGMSMGGSFAISAAAGQPREWNALVLVCTFDTLSGVEIDRLHRWFGPFAPCINPAVEAAITLRGGISPSIVRPIEKARGITIPTLVAHGNQDTLISIKRGQRLYAAFPEGNKKWIEVPGATHGSILVTPLALYSEMSAWYLDHMKQPEKISKE